MAVDDDDDFFAPKAGSSDLGALLGPPPSAAPAPLTEHAASPAASSGGAPRPPAPKEPEFEPAFGDPTLEPAGALRYALRVHLVGTRYRERAAVLRIELADTRHLLDEAHADYGRLAVDVAERDDLPLPAAELAEVKKALEALDKVHADDRAAREERRGREAMARAQHEGATSSLSPYERAQDEAASRLEAAERRREDRKGAVAVAESAFASAATAGADAMRAADRAIDEARAGLRDAEAIYREAVLAYAEARRRTVDAMTRLAAADESVEGLAIEARRAAKDAQRREDQALRRVREAYGRIGAKLLDEGGALPSTEAAHAKATRVRKQRADDLALAESLVRRAGKVDDAALDRGRKLLAASAALPFVLGGLVVLLNR